MKPYPPIETFLWLRRWIGYLGVFLPLAVLLLASLKFQPSISDFYYTASRNWFVGSLSTIGAFLCCYFGHDQTDRRMSVFAGICAFGVALCPTDGGPTTTIGGLHYFFAALLFGSLAWFSGFQFTKSSNLTLKSEGNKRWRNIIYIACAWLICAALVLIFLGKITGLSEKFKSEHPVFWLETVALEAFGCSWMLKGEFILRDQMPGTHWARSLLPKF